MAQRFKPFDKGCNRCPVKQGGVKLDMAGKLCVFAEKIETQIKFGKGEFGFAQRDAHVAKGVNFGHVVLPGNQHVKQRIARQITRRIDGIDDVLKR